MRLLGVFAVTAALTLGATVLHVRGLGFPSWMHPEPLCMPFWGHTVRRVRHHLHVAGRWVLADVSVASTRTEEGQRNWR